ncbi:MAG: GAF domain-containing protein [Melioribacter sp.]|uniref:sensor domain-containing diguanylate cyclase n=1 Tax=Rosettibacter primus TaxID=3111523 RepID=UPI00247C5182|nr:GAF domain-containing protein [Melioribacter sp.]
MGLSDKYRKRLLIFIFIPILIVIPFLTDDSLLKIISGVILLIYVGFIIFLRDTKSETSEYEKSDESPPKINESKIAYEPDDGEEFKIISPVKNIEVITAENFTPSVARTSKDFFKPPDFKENFDKIVREELPKDLSQDEQFGFVLEKILSVVKDAFMAHTAAFFWYNKNRKRLTLERYISSSSQITKQKFDLEDDILGKIVQKEEPEILTDISPNAEADVIRYYSAPQGIKSFVGVPLFYGKNLTGILVLDSKVNDAFGIEQIYSLGKIVRIISVIISLFDEKFSETQAEQRLKALIGILGTDKKFDNETDIYSALDNSMKDLLDWDVFTFVAYSPIEQKFKIARIKNKTSLKYAGENLEVELSGTLVGKAILSFTPVKIDDTSSIDIPRFSKNEDVSFDGSFLAIPLVYDEQNYGVLCFESLKKNIYTNNEVTFIKNATKFFAFILHSYSTINILKSLLTYDIETKALNYDAFIERLTIDLVRSNELNLPGALALIKIDDFLEQESLFDGNPFPKVLKAISQMIKDEMTPMNLWGRLDERIFAVYFFNTTPKDVFLWAEKLRIKIARKPIAVVSRQTTFTVSIGVAATTNKTDVKEILYNAELALKKALEKGGNTVKSI